MHTFSCSKTSRLTPQPYSFDNCGVPLLHCMWPTSAHRDQAATSREPAGTTTSCYHAPLATLHHHVPLQSHCDHWPYSSLIFLSFSRTTKPPQIIHYNHISSTLAKTSGIFDILLLMVVINNNGTLWMWYLDGGAVPTTMTHVLVVKQRWGWLSNYILIVVMAWSEPMAKSRWGHLQWIGVVVHHHTLLSHARSDDASPSRMLSFGLLVSSCTNT